MLYATSYNSLNIENTWRYTHRNCNIYIWKNMVRTVCIIVILVHENSGCFLLYLCEADTRYQVLVTFFSCQGFDPKPTWRQAKEIKTISRKLLLIYQICHTTLCYRYHSPFVMSLVSNTLCGCCNIKWGCKWKSSIVVESESLEITIYTHTPHLKNGNFIFVRKLLLCLYIMFIKNLSIHPCGKGKFRNYNLHTDIRHI